MISRTGIVNMGKSLKGPPLATRNSSTHTGSLNWIISKSSYHGGDQFTCDLMNNASNTETYLKWVQVYNRVLGEKNLCANPDVATGECKKLHKEMKTFLKVPKREAPGLKVLLELEEKRAQYTRSLSGPVMTCSTNCSWMTPKFNGTALLRRSMKWTPGPP